MSKAIDFNSLPDGVGFLPQDAGGDNYENLYTTSFGKMGPSIYQSHLNQIDKRPILRQHIPKLYKALAIGAGTGANLIPVYLDPAIIDLTRREFPFLEVVTRVANRGKSADWRQLTGRANAIWAAEDAALADQDDAYAPQSESICFAYAKGRVTGPMMAASKEYVDSLRLEVNNKTRSLRQLEEMTLLRGTTAGADDSDIYTYNQFGYNGLIKTITTNTTNKSGGAIAIDDIREIIRQCWENNGEINLLVTDGITFNAVKTLLQTNLYYVDIGERLGGRIKWGIQAIDFEGVPLMAVRGMPTVVDKRVMLALDMRHIQIRVLQDVMYQELAITQDSFPFMVKVYEVGIKTAEVFQGQIYGIGIT